MNRIEKINQCSSAEMHSQTRNAFLRNPFHRDEFYGFEAKRKRMKL